MATEPSIKIINEEKAGGDWKFMVEVEDDGRNTQHTVTVGEEYSERFNFEAPDELVLASFRFLLDHEDNESILASFKLSDIPNFFSEYEEQVGNYR